jgi:ketosteroid isomerase-like protein
MPEESTTPDLVERWRRVVDALNSGDFDAVMSFYAPDAVLESMAMATGFEGAAAIRGLFEDMLRPYEEWEIEAEEILDLGNEVAFGVLFQQGRPAGSSSRVQMRLGSVVMMAEGVVTRQTMYTDIDEARAAAERLAEERADG